MWLPWRGPAPCRTASDSRSGPPNPLRRLIAVASSLSSGSEGRIGMRCYPSRPTCGRPRRVGDRPFADTGGRGSSRRALTGWELSLAGASLVGGLQRKAAASPAFLRDGFSTCQASSRRWPTVAPSGTHGAGGARLGIERQPIHSAALGSVISAASQLARRVPSLALGPGIPPG